MPEERMVVCKGAQAAVPSLRDVLTVLFRHRRLVLTSFAAMFLLVVLYAVFSFSYRSHMTLLVRRRRVDPVVTPTPSTPEFARPEITEEELNSEVEIVRDEELLERVASEAGLTPTEGFWPFARESQEVRRARAARCLAQRLDVELVRKTALITVSYEAKDPELAAKVLRLLANRYLQKHEEVHRPTGEFHFFDQQVVEYRRNLAEVEAKLLDFTRDQGVVSGTLERDMALQKLSEVDAGYRQGRIAMAETEQRIRALRAKLASFPERTTTQVRISDNPQLLERLKATLLDLELKRTELLTKFEPNFRLVQEVDQQIAETQASITREEAVPLRDETTEPNANHEWAKAELAKSEVELAALQARNAGTARLLTDSYKQARQLGTDALKQQDLLRDMKQAEENYLLYVKKREEARIGDALDERGIVNVTLAEPPAVPVLPKRSSWKLGLLGLALGGVVSTGLAFTADLLDPSFRTPGEVSAYLGMPVLASLPRKSA